MLRGPSCLPESRLNGASPASAVASARSSEVISERWAMIVQQLTGPKPLTTIRLAIDLAILMYNNFTPHSSLGMRKPSLAHKAA